MSLSLYPTLIVSLLLINSQIHAQKRNVLDYYKMLPVNNEYKISHSDNIYTTSGITETPFEIIVDLKNGYIEIEDEGTGGGTVTHQVVLYRKSDKKALIVHSQKYFDGVGIESKIKFYELLDNKLIEVKKKYHLSNQTFLKNILKEFDEDWDRDVILGLVHPVFKLPQHGLIIEIDFFVATVIGKTSDRMHLLHEKLLKMDFETIKWKWNKVLDRFEFVNP
jgi:hypothetical protein